MAYMSAENAREKRNALKQEFPNWKFSVRKRHGTLSVKILKAPYDLLEYLTCERTPVMTEEEVAEVNSRIRQRRCCSVNDYHLDNRFYGQALDDLQAIVDICNVGNHNNSDIQSDYFDVGWYLDLDIGSDERPFEVV